MQWYRRTTSMRRRRRTKWCRGSGDRVRRKKWMSIKDKVMFRILTMGLKNIIQLDKTTIRIIMIMIITVTLKSSIIMSIKTKLILVSLNTRMIRNMMTILIITKKILSSTLIIERSKFSWKTCTLRRRRSTRSGYSRSS